MGLPFPEEYGGSGGDWVGMHVCIEEISRGDVTLGALLDVTTSVVGEELYQFGTEEQKNAWLVPIAQGRKIGAFGLTEPDAGSDAGATRTTALVALLSVGKDPADCQGNFGGSTAHHQPESPVRAVGKQLWIGSFTSPRM